MIVNPLIEDVNAQLQILALEARIESLHSEYEGDRAALGGVLLEAERYLPHIQDQHEYNDEQYGRNIVRALMEGRAAEYVEETEARVEVAERERDVLAEALAWGAGKDKKPLFQNLPWMDTKAKWLEWARQQARKEAKNA